MPFRVSGFCAVSRRLLRLFRSDVRGQIAVIFAVASTAIVVGVGAGIDLSHAYGARQRLSQVANLTCQYSTRPSVVDTANSTYSGTGGFQTYLTAVNTFAATSLAAQHWTGSMPTGSGGGTTYFTATAPSGSSLVPTNTVAELSANVPTSFMQIVHVSQIAVHAKVNCQTAANNPQIVNASYVVQEGFETSCTTYCFTLPNGTTGTQSTPTSNTTTSPGYVGPSGTGWYIMGYCLEIDTVGIINSSDPEGTHSAELDCDNGNGTAGNSSISTKVYLAVGDYELRYDYRSRVDYPNYDPAYICGTTASDMSWPNDVGANGYGTRTNQINAYLDEATSSTIPTHTTIDGSEQLGGSNLIDMCVYSPTWVERSVKIKVTTAAYYWLSFAADGANDSYGGQLDSIRRCPEVCNSTLQDNFPSAWLAANNGGVNKVLFEDSFESPVYAAQTNWTSSQGNLNLSYGTNSPTSPGWPNQTASGWSTAPYNQTTYVVQGGSPGQQYIELDGCSPSCTSGNRLVSRPFLLDPGYYQVNYNYLSMVNFPSIPISYCYSAPSSGAIFPATGATSGTVRYGSSVSANANTNIVGVFMSHGALVSTPIGGGNQIKWSQPQPTLSSVSGASQSQGSQTSYYNPTGTVTTAPTAAPDSVNWYGYTATQNNPVLDVCGYYPNNNWVPRTVYVKITKPAVYWLTFSANGSQADGYGGAIDDVKLTALGSPYMSSPPTTPLVAIPVPSPANDSTYTNSSAFNGFAIVADPLMPPAADP